MRRGPGGYRSRQPDAQQALIKITPDVLTGGEIADPESPLASTFRVVAAVASIEVSHGLQIVNEYDRAIL